MSNGQHNQPNGSEESTGPAVNTGNASNPSPHTDSLAPSSGSQLLNEKAEKYLREVASIEDVPDAQDQQEMDETLKDES